MQPIIERRGFNKAVVALANKLTRISWVIVTTGEPFDMKQALDIWGESPTFMLRKKPDRALKDPENGDTADDVRR